MRRCPLCHERPTDIGWCGACRQSYRQRGIARANVMEVAQWGADRARQSRRERSKEARQSETVDSILEKIA